jgi:hypothetical protein
MWASASLSRSLALCSVSGLAWITGEAGTSGGVVAGGVLEPPPGGAAAGGLPRVAGTDGLSVVAPAEAGASTGTGNFRREGGSGVVSGGGSAGATAGVRAWTFVQAGAAIAQKTNAAAIETPRLATNISTLSTHGLGDVRRLVEMNPESGAVAKR